MKMTLESYIRRHYNGNQSAFARAIDKPRQQVSTWVNSGEWFVIGDFIYQRKMAVPDKPGQTEL
ncbi:hypothetical protein WAB73_003295 [Salmonella enterica subsp. enterica]